MYQSKVLVNCLEHLKLVLTCTFSSQSSLITSLIAALQEKKLFCISSFNFYNQRRGLFFSVLLQLVPTHMTMVLISLWLLLNS